MEATIFLICLFFSRSNNPPGSILKKPDISSRKCVGAQTQTDCSITHTVVCDKRTSEENVDEGYEGEDEKINNQ